MRGNRNSCVKNAILFYKCLFGSVLAKPDVRLDKDIPVDVDFPQGMIVRVFQDAMGNTLGQGTAPFNPLISGHTEFFQVRFALQSGQNLNGELRLTKA